MAKVGIEILAYETDPEAGYLPGTYMACSPVPVGIQVNAGTFKDIQTHRKGYVRVHRVERDKDGKELVGLPYAEKSFMVENGDVLAVDIQSELRTLMTDYLEAHPFDPNEDLKGNKAPDGYVMEYKLETLRSYVENGVVYSTSGDAVAGGFFAVNGALSERERYALGNDKFISSEKDVILSHKPAGEICISGQKWIRSTLPKIKRSSLGVLVQDNIRRDVLTVGTHTINNIYVVADDGDWKQFCFINSLGEPETICAHCLETKTTEVTPQVFHRVGKVTRRPRLVGQTFVHQPKSYVKMEMSSGAVTAEWAEWWSEEFLRATQWWMLEDGVWWPVTIEPKNKTITKLDRAKGGALEVDFTVTMGMTGNGMRSIISN